MIKYVDQNYLDSRNLLLYSKLSEIDNVEYIMGQLVGKAHIDDWFWIYFGVKKKRRKLCIYTSSACASFLY
jgi:hypothetical protein